MPKNKDELPEVKPGTLRSRRGDAVRSPPIGQKWGFEMTLTTTGVYILHCIGMPDRFTLSMERFSLTFLPPF